MTSFRSRPTIAICLTTGTVVSISLAGLVWAQAPAENWPFEEHTQPAAAQPAPPPKSAVQKRLEELYQRDHRPLPDYMQPDGAGEQAAPATAPQSHVQSPLAGDATAVRNQRDSAATQGTVRQQLSDYYQSQGKTIPTPQQTAAGGKSSSSQSAPSQPGQTSASQPAQVRWYDRINPFHKSTPAAPPQTQAPGSATVSTAAAAKPPVVVASAQAPPPATPAPAAKSGSFWGDLSLRRVPQQANDAPSHPAITVELGTGGHLVPKSSVSDSTGQVSLAQTAPVAPTVTPTVTVHVTAPVAVVAPAVVAIPAEPQVAASASQKVSAANAVADDPAMPFRDSPEADADQQPGSGPYTGLTLEDEQNQLVPPKPEIPKIAAHVAAAHPPATAADAHQAQPAKTVSAAPQTTSSRLAGNEAAAPALPQHEAATGRVHYQQTTADKVRLIGERVGQRGLKGFCPVVLRDERELTDSNPAFCSIYRGQKYFLSSAEAQAAFESAPHKYAPVAGGTDVVVKINSDQSVEGSLDFASWYKDRLYLFCSPESLQTFSNNPTAYAAAAQRIQ
jgi:YHS domain-containing protein